MRKNSFAHYSLQHFQKDLVAGVIVGVIAVPLGMAFAIASGVKPEYGIYTTIIAGLLVAIFGGSKFQIAGPTGAFIPILLGIVMTYGYENLLIAGFLAGVLLLMMGIFKLGSLIRYIPRPVTIGFTTGIAVTIFSGQISNFFGLTGIENHEYFIDKMKEIAMQFYTLNIYSVIVASVGLLCIVLTNKYVKKMPSALVGLIGSTAVATIFFPDQLATIGSTYGTISSELPHLQWPDLTWERMQLLIGPALVIAMLGGIESLLSAVVADEMTGTKHNSNRELIGQGIANMVVPLFGGIPATGAIARTATNVKNGAVSNVSGIVQALVVFVVLLALAPFAAVIPLASMAPILMVVAWNMSERHKFVDIVRMKTWDSTIVITIFLLTVFVDLTTAVCVGLLLSMLIFVKKMSELHVVSKVLPDDTNQCRRVTAQLNGRDCPQVTICTIEGPIFFGSAQTFEETIQRVVHAEAKVVIFRVSKVPYMDATGAINMVNVVRKMHENGGIVFVTGLQQQPMSLLKKVGLYDEMKGKHFYSHTGQAISMALTMLDVNACIGCKQYAFRECSHLSADQYENVVKGEQDERRATKI